MFSFSIKQLLRQPGKVILFLLLMIASTMLVVSGAILTIESSARIQIVEDTYSTVAYVTQLPESYEEFPVSDPCHGDYVMSRPVYGGTILPEDLDFPGAKYVIEPEYRPYYISFQPGLEHTGEHINFKRHVVEFTPLEDSEDGQLVDVRITKVLFSQVRPELGARKSIHYEDHNMEVGDVIPFCQACGRGNYMFPLKAGERYVVSMSMQTDECLLHGLEYYPYHAPNSQQHDARGNDISGGFFTADWTAPDGTPLNKADALRPVTGENFYDEGQPGYKYVLWAEYYEKEDYAFAAMPVNSLKVLTPWHEKETEVEDGREITKEEFADGAPVCMVPGSLAKVNGIRIGDEINMSFISAIYGNFSPAGMQGIIPVDMNVMYNAQGEPFEPFWEQTYEVVGIYRDDTFENGLWSDALLIPARSVQASDENNIAYFEPMTPTVASFQLPNGSIDEFDEAFREAHPELLDRLLIEYDDQGYTEVMKPLRVSRDMSQLLLAGGVLAALAILALLLYFFVVKEKKRTAVERSLGMSKHQCRVSLLAGLMMLTIIAAGVGSVCGGLILDKVEAFTTFQGETAEELDDQYMFDTHYSVWAADRLEAEDTVIEVDMPVAVYGAVPVGICLLVLALSLALMGRSFRIDPIYLLSTKDKG